MTPKRLLVRRLRQLPIVLLGVVLVTFAMVHLTPGDPARALIFQKVTPAILAQVRHALGEDQSVPGQFVTYVGNALQGNLGYSYRLGESVDSLIVARLPITLFLVAYAGILAVLIGLPLAIVAATRNGRWPDKGTRLLLMISLAVPSFWIGVLLVKYVALGTGAFPVGGAGTGFAGHLWYLFLPALTLCLTFLSVLVRSLRAVLIDVLGQDYISFARLKGIPRHRLYTRHILRNALPPALTILGLNMSYLLGASVVVESVFAIPGVGYTLVTAVIERDYQLVQGLALVFALAVVVITLLVDLANAALDPRRGTHA